MTPYPTVKLGRVARIVSGVGFPHLFQGRESGEYPFLKVSDLATQRSGYSVIGAQNWVSRGDLSTLGARLAPTGSVVFPKVGAALLKNPRRLLRQPSAMDNNLMAVVPQVGDPRFWVYALSTIDLGQLASSGPLPFVNEAQIRDLRVSFPSEREQRRIADFLDVETNRIDRLTHLRRCQIDKFDERYNTTISELTTPGISSEEERDALWPWLPASVETGRLGYVARVQSGVTVHGARERTSDDSEYPYLRVANVQGERVDLSEIKTITIPSDMARRSTLRPGDVVMTEANGNPDNLGRGAVWNGEIPNMVHQNHVFAIRVDQSRLIPEYLAVLLAASHGRRYFRFTSAQVGIATTSSSKVLDFPVPVLSLGEQHVIVKRWETARKSKDHTTNLLARQLELLAERRQALITAAVTGQFDASTASGRNVTDGVTA